jgi:hypothetical protein
MVLIPAITFRSLYMSTCIDQKWLESTSRSTNQQQHQEQKAESVESATSIHIISTTAPIAVSQGLDPSIISTDSSNFYSSDLYVPTSTSSLVLSSVSAIASSASQFTPSSSSTAYPPQLSGRLQRTLRRAPFPRWADPHGIGLSTLIDIVEQDLVEDASSMYRDLIKKKRPATPYVMSAHDITTSNAIRSRHEPEFLPGRVEPVESLYLRAWHRWSQIPHQWPNITRALSNNGSFPLLAQYNDFRGCNYHNWQYGNATLSVPVFSPCAHVDCDYAWPQPTYETIHDARLPEEWSTHFDKQDKEYPWESKRKQVLWRGALTGRINKGLDKNVRWAAARLAHTTAAPYWYIGLYIIPPESHDAERNLSEVGGLKAIVPRHEFAKYRAVLDMDGHSWSSRFGRLLCDNSIVLKVEPRFVDYFHFQQDKHGQYELQAGKHYLPVHFNLSNLMEHTEFVMDPRNDAAVQEIIRNAQDWCRSHLTPTRLEEDMLHIWEAYVGHLDQLNLDWSDVWQREQHRWSGPAFDSVTLPLRY